MKSIVVIILALSLGFSSFAKEPVKPVAKAKPTQKKTLRGPASDDESVLVRQFPALQKDCDDLDIMPLALHGQSAEPFEMVVSCTTNCGMGGCPYSVFVRTDKGYRQIAEFFGIYDVLQTQSKGYQDIRVKSSMGIDTKKEITLKYNGAQYQ